MITRIAHHECRVIWRDRRFRWAAGILVALLAIATMVNAQAVERRVAAIDAAARQQREQWLHRSVSNPHIAAHAGITLFRPLDTLAAVDIGIDERLGASVFLEAHRRTLFQSSPAERSAAGHSSQLTVAFTLQVLVPLLIVLLTFPAFAAEREQGTLRYLLGSGARVRDLALGKALGLAAPVMLVTMPVMIVGLAGLYARQPFDLSRGALLVGAYGVFFLAFIGIGLVVSATSKTSQSALVILLGCWLVLCFLAPRGAFALAQYLYPGPNAQEFSAALERIDTGAGSMDFMQQRSAIERRLLAEYHVSTAAELPVSTWGVTLYQREIESTAQYNEQFSRVFEAYAKQQHVIDLVSIVVPSLALRTLSMALAGTDTAHYQHFAEAAEAYRFALVQAMNTVAVESRLYNAASFAQGPDQPVFPEGEKAAYARVGAFGYRRPSAWWALSSARIAASSLAAWSLAVGLAMVWAARRVRVD